MKNLLILSFILLISSTLFAQDSHDEHPHRHGWELGFGLGYAPILNEENAISSHIHLMKSFHGLERFQFGLNVEKLFDEHKHTSVGLLITYQVYKNLFIGVSPGILFTKHDIEWERHFATHFEIHYEVEWEGVHLGPLFEYAVSKEDTHYMFGLHIGIPL